jgi:hypothetical protein
MLPVTALVTAVCSPFWIAAWAIRRLDDAADWMDEVGLPVVEWMQRVYGPRRERRVEAWRKVSNEPAPVHPHVRALRGLSGQMAERPKSGES